jgi:CHAT domain-containing protein
LHRLPFDALLLGDGRHAVQRFAISLAPSARLALASAAGGTAGARGVAFGDARFAPATGLPALPGSGIEARRVAAMVSGETHLGVDATEGALRRSVARGPMVLHLATHARVEDWGLLSSALYFTPSGTDDGRLGAEEIAALRLRGGLVTLSGCRTAGGVVANGEGLQGLTGPFLEAGARAVAATQWAVGDRSITPVVEAFYREVAAGRPAAEALQRAKLASRAAGARPAIWAALTLTGDGDFAPYARPAPPAS